MKDENYELKEINQALSFLRDSWVQVPNETSAARYMRPHFVSMPVAKNKAGNSDHKTPHDFGGQLRVDPVIPPEDQTEPSSQNKTGAGHIGKRSASLRAVSALYVSIRMCLFFSASSPNTNWNLFPTRFPTCHVQPSIMSPQIAMRQCTPEVRIEQMIRPRTRVFLQIRMCPMIRGYPI